MPLGANERISVDSKERKDDTNGKGGRGRGWEEPRYSGASGEIIKDLTFKFKISRFNKSINAPYNYNNLKLFN